MKKQIYLAMLAHPNMNYDRSPISWIKEKFPPIYERYLGYFRNNPSAKVHMHLCPQTLWALRALNSPILGEMEGLLKKGQLKFMAGFFNEPLGILLDDRLALVAAEEGSKIIAREYGRNNMEGFFPQEVVYFPQLPGIVRAVGMEWLTSLLIREYSSDPFFTKGLDGTRIAIVPAIAPEQLAKIDIERLPNNSLLCFLTDMELLLMLATIEDFRERNKDVDFQWCFISEYIKKFPVKEERPWHTYGGVDEGPLCPSFSRWVLDTGDIKQHEEQRKSFSMLKTATRLWEMLGRTNLDLVCQGPSGRSHATYDLDKVWEYPLFDYLSAGENKYLHLAKYLILWGANADACGWYPLLERRLEHAESLQEGASLSKMIIASLLQNVLKGNACGYKILNLDARKRAPVWIEEKMPYDFIGPEGDSVLLGLRQKEEKWEHLLDLDLQASSVTGIEKTSLPKDGPFLIMRSGNKIANATTTISVENDLFKVHGNQYPFEFEIGLKPFQIAVKDLDTMARLPKREGGVRLSTFSRKDVSILQYKTQLDWHIHLKATCLLIGENIYLDWDFFFTYPVYVDPTCVSVTPIMDFKPGGIIMQADTHEPAQLHYEVPMGIVEHITGKESFVGSSGGAFLCNEKGGLLLVSGCGAKGFYAHADKGRIGLCFGRSTSGGPIKKVDYILGQGLEAAHEAMWYPDFFYGAYHYRAGIMAWAGRRDQEKIYADIRAGVEEIALIESIAMKRGQANITHG